MDRAIFPGLVLALALGSAMAGIVGRPDWCLPAALASLALALLRRSPPLLWLAAFFAGLLLWQPSPVPEATRAQIPC
ncbi:TPA: hypothetical protein DCL37_05450 [Candidatus Acetothermia bacterium]|nr:hypothetical protein [Candidatus Acetothermia bacterium]